MVLVAWILYRECICNSLSGARPNTCVDIETSGARCHTCCKTLYLIYVQRFDHNGRIVEVILPFDDHVLFFGTCFYSGVSDIDMVYAY